MHGIPPVKWGGINNIGTDYVQRLDGTRIR